jgi:hypothetical protein
MPKSSIGGVSDKNVDENFIAPPGVPPQDAIDQGLPDAGQNPEAQEREVSNERTSADGDGDKAGSVGDSDAARPVDEPVKQGRRTKR